MAKYRVRDGHVLGHHGRVLSAGETVDLSLTVADDPAVNPHIEAVPEIVAVVVPVLDKVPVKDVVGTRVAPTVKPNALKE